jgi:cytochrome c biogenesis protein CcmG, thiol:disulfide interchange protein DsbE
MSRREAEAVMTRGAFLRSLGASALTVLGACGGSMGNAESAGKSELVGAPAPDFSLAPAEGGAALGPKAFAGKVVIVDFWATWCAPCKESFPAYQRMVDKFGGELVVVGVSVDDDPKGIASFRSATGVKFPLVWDEGQVAAGVYRPGTMPTSFVLDRHGIVQFVHEGFRTGDESAIEEHVRSLLK